MGLMPRKSAPALPATSLGSGAVDRSAAVINAVHSDSERGTEMVPTVALGDALTVSTMRFGAMVLNPVYDGTDDVESLATLNRCLDLGVTFIDTANVYGGGDNERLIAKVLAGRRDEVTLATKFGIVDNPADRVAGGPSARGDSA